MDITDRVPALIAAYNITTGQYLYVNNTSKALLGYSPQEFIKGGIPFAISLVHPDDMPQITRQNQEALAAANRKKSIRPDGTMIVNFEYRMKHKKGHWVWLHTVGNVLSRDPKTNRVNQVVNISFDITQRKESEKQALLDIEQINYALDQSAIVAVTDKAGMIQYVNDKFLEISHYSKDELVGKTHRVINSKYHPPEFF